MKPFNDDDLKRLKDKIAIDKSIDDYVTSIEKASALLARLDAAEANMGGHSGPCENGGGGICSCMKGHREASWRKASGR